MTFFQYLLVYLIQMCFGYNMNYIVLMPVTTENIHKLKNFTSWLESSQIVYSFLNCLWSH